MKTLATLGLIGLSAASMAEELDVRAFPERDEFILKVTTAMVELEPGNDDFVRVAYDCAAPPAKESEDGLRVVKKAGAVPNLSRSSNRIEVRLSEEVGDCRVRVTAPPSLATRLRIEGAGRIRVRDWQGSLTAWSAAGDVEVLNQKGPFSLTAMSGDATLEFTGTELAVDSAVTAANGTVTVALPGNPPAAIRARAKWGNIRTDLDVSFYDEADANGVWSVTELNGGGPLITLRNLNEDIELLERL